jgi:hypothetical protein
MRLLAFGVRVLCRCARCMYLGARWIVAGYRLQVGEGSGRMVAGSDRKFPGLKT